MTAEAIIAQFGLKPHPEGGHFRETYRSMGEIHEDALPREFRGNRNYATGIYFLLTSDTFSAFHRIKQDEMWHFYAGSPIKLHIISDSGAYESHIIGNDFLHGEIPQLTVPAHHWFAAETITPDSYSFVGCTVSPGFDFEDFVLPKRIELLEKFPQHEDIIKKFTRT